MPFSTCRFLGRRLFLEQKWIFENANGLQAVGCTIQYIAHSVPLVSHTALSKTVNHYQCVHHVITTRQKKAYRFCNTRQSPHLSCCRTDTLFCAQCLFSWLSACVFTPWLCASKALCASAASTMFYKANRKIFSAKVNIMCHYRGCCITRPTDTYL